jgi:hypothetical protein
MGAELWVSSPVLHEIHRRTIELDDRRRLALLLILKGFSIQGLADFLGFDPSPERRWMIRNGHPGHPGSRLGLFEVGRENGHLATRSPPSVDCPRAL